LHSLSGGTFSQVVDHTHHDSTAALRMKSNANIAKFVRTTEAKSTLRRIKQTDKWLVRVAAVINRQEFLDG
jgi:hypothetical protein